MPDASPDSDRKPILAVICLGDQNTGIASFFLDLSAQEAVDQPIGISNRDTI
jgi:hypothetical protein